MTTKIVGFLWQPWIAPPTNVIFRGILRSLPDQPVQPLQQQSLFPNFALLHVTAAPFFQSDWPNPQQPWRLEQTWTRSYNLNLIGQDAMLVGEQIYDLAPSQRVPDQIQLRSWQWSYNLSLIGKDRMIVGKQAYDLSPKQVPPEQIQLHSWSWQYNLNLIGKDALVTGGQIYDLPPRDPREVRTWSWQYNVNLIGQDRMVVGEQTYDRPTLAIPPVPPTWTWQYNPNLIGQDLLPFRQLDWPVPRAAQQPAFSWVDVFKVWLTAPALNITISQYWERPTLPVPAARTWTWSYNLDLIGQDQLATGEQVYDLAPSQRPYEQPQLHHWQWSYNLNLIGKDRLPTGEQIYDRPILAIPPSALTWIETPQYELIAKPFLQTEWPNPTQPYRIDQTWTWSYNLNLVGQDRMVTGEQSTDLPPRDFARLFQTWISTVNLALTTAPPNLYAQARQQDWPLPRGAEPDWRRSWEFSYNKNLIGQDQLPAGEQIYDRPVLGTLAAQTWIDQTKILLTAVQAPFNQFDWQLPQVARVAVQTWVNTICIGVYAKPFAQTDWPNPTPFAREPTLTSITESFNLNLIGRDRLPFRQSDWPLSAAHILSRVPLQIMVAGKPFFLVPPQPLPPGAQFYGRPDLRPGTAADLVNPAWRWPQITPPAVTGVTPLRTLMGTGV